LTLSAATLHGVDPRSSGDSADSTKSI
jgi:hypothetical protein